MIRNKIWVNRRKKILINIKNIVAGLHLHHQPIQTKFDEKVLHLLPLIIVFFSFQSENQWQEATHNDSNNDAPGGAIVKGPTMPTQADLQQIV